MNQSGSGAAEEMSFTPEPGVSYRLLVYEAFGDEGEYELTIIP
ncbi:MAG: hypothetical protein R3C44_07925 [Chloroflexota bacterium]